MNIAQFSHAFSEVPQLHPIERVKLAMGWIDNDPEYGAWLDADFDVMHATVDPMLAFWTTETIFPRALAGIVRSLIDVENGNFGSNLKLLQRAMDSYVKLPPSHSILATDEQLQIAMEASRAALPALISCTDGLHMKECARLRVLIENHWLPWLGKAPTISRLSRE